MRSDQAGYRRQLRSENSAARSGVGEAMAACSSVAMARSLTTKVEVSVARCGCKAGFSGSLHVHSSEQDKGDSLLDQRAGERDVPEESAADAHREDQRVGKMKDKRQLWLDRPRERERRREDGDADDIQ